MYMLEEKRDFLGSSVNSGVNSSIFEDFNSFIECQKKFNYGSEYTVDDLLVCETQIEKNSKKSKKSGIYHGLLKQHVSNYFELDYLSQRLINTQINTKLRINLTNVINTFKLFIFIKLNTSKSKFIDHKKFSDFEGKFHSLNFIERILFVLIVVQYEFCIKTKIHFNINSVIINLLKTNMRILCMIVLKNDFFTSLFNEILLYTGTNPNNIKNFDFKINFEFSNKIDFNVYINACLTGVIIIDSLTEISTLTNDKDSKIRNYSFNKVSKYDLEQRLRDRCKFLVCFSEITDGESDTSDYSESDGNVLYMNCIRIISVMCFEVENQADFLLNEIGVKSREDSKKEKGNSDSDKYILTAIKIIAAQVDFFNFPDKQILYFSQVCEDIKNNKVVADTLKLNKSTHFITRLKVLRSKVKTNQKKSDSTGYDGIETMFYYKLNINITNDIILGINLNISSSPYCRYKHLLVTDNIFLTVNVVKRGYFQKKTNRLDKSSVEILSKNRLYIDSKFFNNIFIRFYIPKLNCIELDVKPTFENVLQLIQDTKTLKILELKTEVQINIIKLIDYHIKQLDKVTTNTKNSDFDNMVDNFILSNSEILEKKSKPINFIVPYDTDGNEDTSNPYLDSIDVVKDNSEFIKTYSKHKVKLHKIYELSRLYNTFYSIPICLGLLKNEGGFFTSHFLDFRGRLYPSTSASALNIKYIRPFFCSLKQVKSNINGNLIYNTITFTEEFVNSLNNSTYYNNIVRNKINLYNYEKYIKNDYDYIFLLLLFIELGKVNKTKIMVDSRVSISNFVNEGIKIYELSDFITDDIADYSHYLSIKDCIDNFINTGLFNNITIFKDSTASTFQHWAHILGTNTNFDEVLNLSGNDWTDPYSIMIANFIDDKYSNLKNDDYFMKITSRSILKKVLMTYGYSVTLWTSKRNYIDELKERGLYSEKLNDFYYSILLNLFDYLDSGLFNKVFTIDKHNYLRVLFNDTNYNTNNKSIDLDIEALLSIKKCTVVDDNINNSLFSKLLDSKINRLTTKKPQNNDVNIINNNEVDLTNEEEDIILKNKFEFKRPTNNVSNYELIDIEEPYTVLVEDNKIDLRYYKVKTTKTTLTYHGVRTSRTVKTMSDEIHIEKLRNACSANLIHAWDAALMSYVVNNVKSVITLHDSFGVALSDVPFLMDLVNGWFIKKNSKFKGSLFILL